MSPLTIYLGRVFGLFTLVLCFCLIARPAASLAAIASLIASPGLTLITGVFTLGAGAAMVIGHNLWTRRALTVAVTVLGWVTLLKGLALLIVPPATLAALYGALHYPAGFVPVMGLGAIFGAWVALMAFRASPGPETR